MRASEFILEAKPENLGQGMLDKLFATYQQRDANDNTLPEKFENGLRVANLIFQNVGPAYLIWVAKQYNQDPNFFLHDLPTWRADLNKFNRMTRGTQYQIEKDLNKYQDIEQLRATMQDAMGDHGQVVSKFYQDVTNVMNDYVAKGEATWLYKSPQYSIYYPKTWESSNICKSVMSTNVCTIMNKGHYDDYSANGTLMYIVTQNRLYNCYISKDKNKKRSEFADQQNDHNFDLGWMLEHFPALKPLIKKVTTPSTDTSVQLAVMDDADANRIVTGMVKSDPYNLREVPQNLKTPELCMLAVGENGATLQYVPEQLRTPEMCKTAVAHEITTQDQWMYSSPVLQFVPVMLRTPEVCKLATERNPASLPYVPEKYRTYDMCLDAVSEYPFVIGSVPPELIDERMVKRAVAKRPEAIVKIPPEMITYEVADFVVKRNPQLLRNIPEQILIKYPQISIDAVNMTADILKYVPISVRRTPEFIESVFGGNDESLEKVSDADDDILEKIVKKFNDKVDVRDFMYQIINDAEDSDDGFNEFLNDQSSEFVIMPEESPWGSNYYEGTDEQDEWLEEHDLSPVDLEVDWEGLRDSYSYLDYSQNANRFYDAADEITHPSGERLKELVDDFEALHRGDAPTLADIPTLIAMNVEDHYYGDEWFTKELGKHLRKYTLGIINGNVVIFGDRW